MTDALKGDAGLIRELAKLLEETGYTSEDWSPLGAFQSNSNQGGGKIFMFEARGARKTAEADSGDLEEIEVVLLDDAQLQEAIRGGEMMALSSVTACSLALNSWHQSGKAPE